MNKKQIRLTESDLHRIVKESVKKLLKEGENNALYFQEKLYKLIGQLVIDLKTVIKNTDTSNQQSFGSTEDKLRSISNLMYHTDKNMAQQAESTFGKLLQVINELEEIQQSLLTLGSNSRWGHESFGYPNGSVPLSNSY